MVYNIRIIQVVTLPMLAWSMMILPIHIRTHHTTVNRTMMLNPTNPMMQISINIILKVCRTTIMLVRLPSPTTLHHSLHLPLQRLLYTLDIILTSMVSQ